MHTIVSTGHELLDLGEEGEVIKYFHEHTHMLLYNLRCALLMGLLLRAPKTAS
jgi:hypothetical protein